MRRESVRRPGSIYPRIHRRNLARLRGGIQPRAIYGYPVHGPSELGPTLSFKGINNASYTGCCPMSRAITSMTLAPEIPLNLSHMRVIEFVADSLRYWQSKLTSTGFALILESVSPARPRVSTPESGFLKAYCQDPELRTVKLVAEP